MAGLNKTTVASMNREELQSAHVDKMKGYRMRYLLA